MNATSYVVAPHTNLGRHDFLVRSLDAIFREHHVPPAILQHSFVDRRPTTHYTELANLLTPFPTQPTSELLEDIGRAVAPAQTRFTTLLSSHYPPVFPPVPATALYAPPNEDKFIVARSSLQPVMGQGTLRPMNEFKADFESALVIDSDCNQNQMRATLKASFIAKTNPDKPNTATLAVTCPWLTIQTNQSASSHRHSYVLHSLSATARQDPAAPVPYVLTPHFAPRDPRFERICNGLRYECTWTWEVLDEELRVSGFGVDDGADRCGPSATAVGASGLKLPCATHSPAVSKQRSSPPKLPTEHINISIPLSSSSPPSPIRIIFTATLASTAGLDAIDAIHRTGQWADRTTLEGLQRAFDSAHPAMQVLHHVVRVEIPDVGEMVRAGLAGLGPTEGTNANERIGGWEGETIGGHNLTGVRMEVPERVYAPAAGLAIGGVTYSGSLRFGLDRDAGVVGRRGDEDEEGNSDEDDV